MTQEDQQQVDAFIKLHEDVKQLVRDAMVEVLRGYDREVVTKLQDLTLGSPEFERRVRQAMINQMQR